eukprot:g435.t1
MKVFIICFAMLMCVSGLPSDRFGKIQQGRKLKSDTNSTVTIESSVIVTTEQSTEASSHVTSNVQTSTSGGGAAATASPSNRDCEQVMQPDGSTREICAEPFRPPNTVDACNIPRTTAARRSNGLIRTLDGTDSPSACCEICRGVPGSACRSWWRGDGSNRRCYLNSNP